MTWVASRYRTAVRVLPGTLLVASDEGPQFRVVPTYAMSATSEIPQTARDRLRERHGKEPASNQIVVVPNRSRYEDPDPVDGPRVIRLMDLTIALAQAPAPSAR